MSVHYLLVFNQVIVAVVKGLIIVNKNLFYGLSTLVIASLLGIATDLNPNETIQISSNEASWFCKWKLDAISTQFDYTEIYSLFAATFTMIGYPFGILSSGMISDTVGRRRALMVVVVAAAMPFAMLTFSTTFIFISLASFWLSFIIGLSDAPSFISISGFAEPSVFVE